MSAAGLPKRCWECQADRCKTSILAGYLSKYDLLASPPLDDLDPDEREAELTRRDQDRIRIVKRLSSAPGGLPLKTIVSEVIKGQKPGECERFDGSDSDYQFAYRFCNKLQDRGFARKKDSPAGNVFAPTTELLDLISDGIRETHHATDENLYDREFVKQILNSTDSLTDTQKKHAERSLQSYINRVDDYELLFETVTYDRTGEQRQTMTKPYKTRFNDYGRIAKQFSKFHDALEYKLEHADNAVLATLTTDPGTYTDASRPNPRPLADQISSINPNFHRLTQYLKSDPSTKLDTRSENVVGWRPDLDDDVTGRPREKLDYIKVLEFSENGYPHLHVLFFDVPTREKDGMPWLIDKQELSAKWSDYGQGQIVDTYPLVKRDLDELDADFAGDSEQGFVDWYRFGDHDHSDEWIAERQDAHDRIDFDDHSQQKEATAGAYIGKYLSAVFGGLMEQNGSIDVPDDHRYSDKAATWKLALYWATQKQFWSMSERLENSIKEYDHKRDDPDVATAVRWATLDTITAEARPEVLDQYARRRIESIDDLEDDVEEALGNIATPNVESTLDEPAEFGVLINYLGAYPVWNLPTEEISAPELDDTTTEFGQAHQPLKSTTDRPPPIEEFWNSHSAET
ncbi:hypothetical protein [Halovenus sp. HT40]|uniref:hypothetical protein n=1 Tax=Halovenus sp. HT40 TaxID=3126691 RepID=UPI00300F485B